MSLVVADAGPLHYLILVALPTVLNDLQATNFFISPKVIQAALERDKQRRAGRLGPQ